MSDLYHGDSECPKHTHSRGINVLLQHFNFIHMYLSSTLSCVFCLLFIFISIVNAIQLDLFPSDGAIFIIIYERNLDILIRAFCGILAFALPHKKCQQLQKASERSREARQCGELNEMSFETSVSF
jgi:hypothetical protein